MGALGRLQLLSADANCIESVPTAILRGCSSLATLTLHNNRPIDYYLVLSHNAGPACIHTCLRVQGRLNDHACGNAQTPNYHASYESDVRYSLPSTLQRLQCTSPTVDFLMHALLNTHHFISKQYLFANAWESNFLDT